jgi:hypothetical protein
MQINKLNEEPAQPKEVERVIPFNIERWRTHDFDGCPKTVNNKLVNCLTYLSAAKRLVGYADGVLCDWFESGRHTTDPSGNLDLMLVVKGEGGDE